nr:MAG TPA: hypothetical protein [Bacteriophage sp.]
MFSIVLFCYTKYLLYLCKRKQIIKQKIQDYESNI